MIVMSAPHQESGPTFNTTLRTSLNESSYRSPIGPSSSQQEMIRGTSTPESSSSLDSALDKASRAPTIPKLSSATRALMARANYSNSGTVPVRTNFPNNTSCDGSTDARMNQLGEKRDSFFPGKMRLTSAILELPLAPFPKYDPPNRVGASAMGHFQPQQIPSTIPPVSETRQASAIIAKNALPTLTPKLIPTFPTQTSPPPPPQKEQKKTTSRGGKNGISRTKRKRKRRRNKGSDDENIRADDSSSDESETLTPVATQTKSGRQVHRPSLFVPPPLPLSATKPKATSGQMSNGGATNSSLVKRRKVYRKGKEQHVTCMHCQRGHSPSTNTIVFCDGCNRTWHQFCHNPPIEKAVIEVKEAEWYCVGCRPTQSCLHPTQQTRQRVSSLAATEISQNIPQPSMELLTHGSRKDTSQKLGARAFTRNERLGYLTALSHSELVDLLLDISEQNPDVPVFPVNSRDLATSQSHVPVNGTTPPAPTEMNQFGAIRTNDYIVLNTEAVPDQAVMSNRKTQGISHENQRRRTDNYSDDSGSEYEIEEHRLYPRPGNGFRLPPESEDLNILLESPTCPTFSYSLHRQFDQSVNVTPLIPA